MLRSQRGGVLLGLLAVFFLLLVTGTVGGAYYLYITTPLPTPRVPEATEVFDVKGRSIGRLFVENRIEVPISRVPLHLRQAVIAVEDQGFFRHRGIEPLALLRALWRNIQARQVVEGGSTITQQLAKNLFLTHERTLWRKLREAVLTLKLEAAYSKEEILQMYLNTIYLGSGVYGVEVAAQTYFGKSVEDLTLAESALIAGLPRAPEVYSPLVNKELSRERRDYVLERMALSGAITREEAERAMATPVQLAPPKPPAGEAQYFMSYVVEVLKERHPEVAQDLLRGGYRIHTSLDLDMQRAASAALLRGLPQGKADARGVLQPQGAIVALDPVTGQIKAMVGGRGFEQTPYNRATQARRQPGSAFKPFLYATVLETHYWTAATPQMCEPISYPLGGGRFYTPRDWDREAHFRTLSVREAIRVSDNVVAVRWINDLGPARCAATAQKLGIESPLEPNLTLALGTSGVTVLEMARAFAPFANGGFRVDPLPILRIEDRQGKLVADYRPRTHKVLDERIAYILTDIMREVFRPGGTAGQVAGIIGNRPAAGKTGTTEHNRDAWTIGYTPRLVAAVWVGNDDESVALPQTGAFIAAPIWGDFVKTVLQGVAHEEFRRPPGIVEALVCPEHGLLANPWDTAVRELFIAGTQPTAYCPTLPPPPPAPELPPPAPPAPPAEPPAQQAPWWRLPLPRLPWPFRP